MKLKLLIILMLIATLITGCSETEVKPEPKFKTYEITRGQYEMVSYTIEDDYEEVDLMEAFNEDRKNIEEYRKYRAVRNQADREKEERERLECYKHEDKDPDEYYLEECEE